MSPCRVTRLLTNDRFRGQRLLCQRRVVTMSFVCKISTTPAAEKNAFQLPRARLLQELREPNETGAYIGLYIYIYIYI